MLKRSVDTAACAAMIQQAAESTYQSRVWGEPEPVYYAMRTVLVDVLGYMTAEQYDKAVEQMIAEVLPLLYAETQAQLEYEYQQEYNI